LCVHFIEHVKHWINP